jgi:hypothetical protein
MREANTLNQRVMETFASRQAYQVIKGHYIPIINDGSSDESSLDLEKRKYYIQKYEFTMMGFLMDENDFEVTPAISRTFQMYEVDQRPVKRPQKKQEPIQLETITLSYPLGDVTQEYFFSYICNLFFDQSTNVESYSVFINDNYYGDDVTEIQINTDDNLRIEIVKQIGDMPTSLSFSQKLI